MSALAADPRGLKRICNGCGARFYDLNKRPIICPSCDLEFTGEIQVKTRRGKVAAATEGQIEEKTAKAAANDEDGEIEAEVEVVSLDDAEAPAADDSDDEAEEVAGDLDLDELEADDDLDDDGDDLDGLEGDVDLTTDKD